MKIIGTTDVFVAAAIGGGRGVEPEGAQRRDECYVELDIEFILGCLCSLHCVANKCAKRSHLTTMTLQGVTSLHSGDAARGRVVHGIFRRNKSKK
jgi:hypothetical protein